MTTPQEAAMRRALEYAEAQCRGRCNAEYNPCHAYEIADCLRTALAQQSSIEEAVLAERNKWRKYLLENFGLEME